MRRVLTASLVLAFIVFGGLPVSASSYTWGYTFQRDRATVAPVAQDAANVPELDVNTAVPFIVPLPGYSQSSPVIVGGTWYEWTYWNGGQKGALWTGLLDQSSGTSSSGTPITLPGQSGAMVTARPTERLNEPSDAAVSPDGKWVAFSAGKELYWWPAGDPSAGAFAQITGPSYTSANSTSPTFVPDSSAPSGWDVCDGNWNGGFACFQVAKGNGAPPPPTVTYLATYTTPADGDGYTAITSSAAYGGPLHDLYFGVASAYDPRVMALNPQSGAFYAMDGRGSGHRVQAPIWASVALDGNSVYATDVNGSAYLFNATTGDLVHEMISYSSSANIVSPAVSGNSLYLVVSAYGLIFRLNRHTLRYANFAPARLDSVTQASAITVVRDQGLPPELFYATVDGGVSIAVPGPAGQSAAAGQYTIRQIGAWTGAPAGGTYNWTAAVVDGRDVMLWSDGAATTWQQQNAPEATPPPGFGAVQGGIQIYHLLPRLTALVTPTLLTVRQGTAYLDILAAPGSTVAASGGPWGQFKVRPKTGGAAACPAALSAQQGPNFGVFPQQGTAQSVGPLAGCGPFSQLSGVLTQYAQSYGGGRYPAYAGLLPASWQAAGVGYTAWQAALPAPSTEGAFPITVTATLPDGNSSSEQVWLGTACTAGWGADTSGACTINVTPVHNAWGNKFSPAGDKCPPDVAPGVNTMTQQEFNLLCMPLVPWLTDQNVINCYGTWWNWINHWYVKKSCVMPGYGKYVGPNGP